MIMTFLDDFSNQKNKKVLILNNIKVQMSC